MLFDPHSPTPDVIPALIEPLEPRLLLDGSYALGFADGQNASVADSASLDISGQALTVEAWINNTAGNDWDGMSIFRRDVADYAGNNWTRKHGLWGYDNGRIHFSLVIDGIYKEIYASAPRNQWVHVAGVYDGSQMRLYFDGAEQTSTAATGNLTVNNNAWRLGYGFEGAIDELRVSDSVRYTANFTPATGESSADANSAMLAHFNEGAGNTADDASSNGNTVTLISAGWTTGAPLATSGNSLPVAADDLFALESGRVVTIDLPGLLGNDSDADDDPLTASLVAGPANGSLMLDPDGVFYYQAPAGFDGTDSFSYVINDGSGDSNVATVSLVVIDPTIPADWTQDAFDAANTGVTNTDPGDGDNWSYLWGWNGPGSTPGTTDEHTYDAPREARIITGGSHVYAPAGSSGLYALSKLDGSVAWQFTAAAVNAPSAYNQADQTLLTPGADGRLYKLDADSGSVLDSYNAGSGLNKSVVLDGGFAYVVADNGTLHKVDTSTMTLAWASAYVAGSSAATPAAVSAEHGVAVLCTDDLYVHGVSLADGSQLWRVKPSIHTAGYPYEFEFGWPVIAEQHGIVFVRMNLGGNQVWSGPLPGGAYPTTNAAIRQHLIDNPQWQSLFALDIADGNTAFIPAVGGGSVEDYHNGPITRVGTMPIVKTYGGEEVVYMVFRNGISGTDGRWDSHVGEMVLDDTTVPGYVAGDLRFVEWTNTQSDITDEQTPLTMAGSTLFYSHWGAAESTRILDRSDSLGSYASPIQTDENPVNIRRISSSQTSNTATHWINTGLTLYEDGRYWTGPGWWTYWNVIDPPGEGTPTGSAYSAGILPRYTIVADGLVIMEGNGGDLFVLASGNMRPVADDATTTTDQGAAATGQVTAQDPDGDTLAYYLYDGPDHGTVELGSDGQFVYTPAGGFAGTDSFRFRVGDGSDVSSNLGLVTITVNATSLPGDANGDGTVDDADYTIWADNYGGSGAGDFNGDGSVDDADYTIWADNYGLTLLVGGSGSAAIVTDEMLLQETSILDEQTKPAETAVPTPPIEPLWLQMPAATPAGPALADVLAESPGPRTPAKAAWQDASEQAAFHRDHFPPHRPSPAAMQPIARTGFDPLSVEPLGVLTSPGV